MSRCVYECGICGGLHPWGWNGDCREPRSRVERETDGMVVRSMEERVEADERGEA